MKSFPMGDSNTDSPLQFVILPSNDGWQLEFEGSRLSHNASALRAFAAVALCYKIESHKHPHVAINIRATHLGNESVAQTYFKSACEYVTNVWSRGTGAAHKILSQY